MHEAGLAYQLLDAAVRCSGGRAGVARVVVGVNAVAGVDVEELRSLLATLSRGSILEGAVFEVAVFEPRLKCSVCGYVWRLTGRDRDRLVGEKPWLREALHVNPRIVVEHVSCPRCGSGRVVMEDTEAVRVMELVYRDGGRRYC